MPYKTLDTAMHNGFTYKLIDTNLKNVYIVVKVYDNMVVHSSRTITLNSTTNWLDTYLIMQKVKRAMHL